MQNPIKSNFSIHLHKIFYASEFILLAVFELSVEINVHARVKIDYVLPTELIHSVDWKDRAIFSIFRWGQFWFSMSAGLVLLIEAIE